MGSVRAICTSALMAALTALGGCSAVTGGTTSSNPDRLDSSSSLSEEQLMSMRDSYLKEQASQYHVPNPPRVDLVRWTDMTNYAPTMVDCLADRGFTATAVGGSGLDFPDVPRSQDTAYATALYTCTAEFTIHPYLNLPPSQAALEKMYDWYVNTSMPCLQAQGIDVPSPPTRETWVDASLTGRPPWLPWEAVPQLDQGGTPSQLARLEAACPQDVPPSEVLEHGPVIQH